MKKEESKMIKKLVVVLIGSIVLVGISKISFAAMCHAAGHTEDHKAAPAQIESEAIDVGNKICPVMNARIKDKTRTTYEYKGKVYSFCCQGCVDEFKKDPEKYIKKIEEESKKKESSHEHSVR
jgi:YHS domain-containing protein